MKFTFKKNKPEGRYSWVHNPTYDIKLKGKIVGSIEHETWDIRLMIIKDDINEDGNPNCKWKWVKLKKKSETLEEAKEWLNSVIDKLLEKYKLQ